MGGSGWGIRVDVNEELKFLGKFTKNSGEVGVRWGVGLVLGDVNAMLGVGVMWGMGDVNQEQKVLYNVQKGIVQY